MKFEKKVIGTLNKCYSLAELQYKGEHCFLVAAEKEDPCFLFNEKGEKLDTVWDGPGGGEHPQHSQQPGLLLGVHSGL